MESLFFLFSYSHQRHFTFYLWRDWWDGSYSHGILNPDFLPIWNALEFFMQLFLIHTSKEIFVRIKFIHKKIICYLWCQHFFFYVHLLNAQKWIRYHWKYFEQAFDVVHPHFAKIHCRLETCSQLTVNKNLFHQIASKSAKASYGSIC